MNTDFEEHFKSDENWKFFNDFSEIEDNNKEETTIITKNEEEEEVKEEKSLICSICTCQIESNFFFFCRECNFFLCKLCNLTFSPKENVFCICSKKNRKVYSSLRVLEFPLFSNHFDIWISDAFIDFLKIISIFYSYVQDRSITSIFYAYRYFNSTLFKPYTTFTKVGIFKKSENYEGYHIILQVFSGMFYSTSYEFFVKKFSSLEKSLSEFKIKYSDDNEISIFLRYIMNEMESEKNSSIRSLKKKLKFIINF